jgi:Ca2+-binding RTX toxin-like protein
VDSSSAAIIDAGDGNDTVRLVSNQAVTVTLGSGADSLILDGWNGSSAVTVTDFTPGEDRLDITSLLNNSLVNWDGSSNPFGAGFLQLVQDGTDAVLQIDRDAGGSAFDATTLVRFQNTSAASFTAANFNPPYPPDGSGIFGQSPTGTAAADTLGGTIGDDVISGLGGDDSINGGNGNDRLIGGAGNDLLTGGFGSDTFVFNQPGDGMDTITDFKAGPNIPFGDHLEISAAGFGGGLVAGATPVLIVTPDPASASHGGTDGYFIFENSGPDAGTVLWDPTGGSGADAVAIVKLTGVTSLLPSDLHVV